MYEEVLSIENNGEEGLDEAIYKNNLPEMYVGKI